MYIYVSVYSLLNSDYDFFPHSLLGSGSNTVR